MIAYKKIYIDHFGYSTEDFIPCEVCGGRSVDIHHIKARGMGGSKHRDKIDNLMALCRNCHVKYGDKKQYYQYLKEIHKMKLTDK